MRVVVSMTNNKYCNIKADRIVDGGDDGMIYIYSDSEIVGVFDKGVVECCYITEQKKPQEVE